MTELHFPARKSVIVVVDDDPELVEVARVTLEAKGYNVMCAYIGSQLYAGL